MPFISDIIIIVSIISVAERKGNSLIYKVDNNCMLYFQFIKEMESKFRFEDRIKKLCRIEKKNRSELSISIEHKGSKNILNISWKDGSPVDFDFSGINVDDLDITPREYHGSNINRYLDKETSEKLRGRLNYEYFFVNTTLFIDIPGRSGVELKFRIKGIELLNEHDSIAISYTRDMINDLVEDVCYIY